MSATVIEEITWNEDGTPCRWTVPSDTHEGYFVVVCHVPGEKLTCTCPAGARRTRLGAQGASHPFCKHVAAVVRLVEDRVA